MGISHGEMTREEFFEFNQGYFADVLRRIGK